MTVKKSTLLATSLLTSLTAALVIAAPAAAQAQDAPVVTQDQATEVESVVVTGSRIRRDPTTSPTPLIQIGQEELMQSGEVNVIDFLADIPALSTSVVPEDTTGSNLNDGGLSLLSLRALGSVRTLTLVDGRRHVGSSPGTLSVDVDTIPRLLVASAEVVTGGNAAVYGADAVTGVVNFILKKDFDGLEIDAAVAQINQDGQLSERLSLLWGQNLMDDRLNYYVSGEFQRNDEVLDTDIDWKRESWGLLANDTDPSAAPNDGVPDLILVRDLRTYIRGTNFGGVTILATGVRPSPASDPDVPFQTCSNTTFSANCFSLAPSNRLDNGFLYDSSGVSRPVTFGSIRQGAGFTRNSSNGGEGMVQNTEQAQASRLPESTNYRFQTGFNFDLTDSVELFAEAKYVEEETYDAGQRVFHDFNIRQFAPGTVGAITATSAFEIGLDNAYLPSNVRDAILNNRRDVYNSAGVITEANRPDPRAQHKLYGPARSQTNNRDLQRYVVGLRGDLGDVGFYRNASWEAGYTYGEMNNSNEELGVDIVRYQAAADAVVDTAGIVNGTPGEIVCRVQLLQAQGVAIPDAVLSGETYSRQGAVIDDCSPVRVFGPDGFTQEGLDYLQASITVTDQNKQHDFMAFTTGELWDLWGAGPIGVALGYEYRKEITSGVGRDAGTAGRLLFLNTGPDFAEASYDTNDYFAELSVPLFTDTPFGSSEISGAYRLSDYSHVGKQDTYSAQFQWSPSDQFLFRATMATAIRVPNLSETNEPYGQTFANGFSDPCSATVINNLADRTVANNRIANCAALATAAGLSFTFNDPSAPDAYLPNYGSGSVPGLAGGNPFLQPETSESFTVGGVWTPDYLIPNLSIVLDYYDIEITDAISAVTAQAAANQCVSGDQVNTGACATITRSGSSFLVTSFIQGSLNYAALTAKGVDFTARYGFDLPEWGGRYWGSFSHSIRGNWLIEQHDFVNIADPTDSSDFEDTVGMPRVRFLSTVTWSPSDSLAFTWDWDWQASQEIEDIDTIGRGNLDRYETLEYLQTGEFSQHDFSVRWNAREDVTVRAGVVNAFDAEPARWLGNTTADNFDLFGRRFFLSLNYRPF